MGKTREIGDLVSDNLFSTDISNDLVGIGSTQPSSKLDVDGDVKVSGAVTATSLDTGSLKVTGIGTIGNIEIDNTTIENTNFGGTLILAAKANMQLRVNSSSSNLAMVANSGGSVDLYHNNTKKFETTGFGVTVTGIASATSFSGDGSNLTGIVTSITAGDNISIDSSTGSVTITGLANTANIVSDTIDTGSLNVTGVSTFNGPGTEVIRIATQTRSASSQEEFGIGFASNVDDTHPAALITYQEFDNDDFRGELAFYTRSSTGDTVPTEKMRITKDGDIGIGTNNPNRRLDVRGSGSVARFGTEDQIGDRIEIDVSDTGYPKILNVSSSDTLSVVSRGSVQIAIDSNNNSTDKIFNVVSNGDSGSGTELFRIDEDGEIAASGNINVSGVVTTSKLHVDPVGSGITYNEDLVVLGNARVTGILSIGTSSIVLDANAKTIRGINEIRIDSDEDDDTPVIIRQRRGRTFFKKTRRNHSNQIVEVEEEASVGIGTTVSINTSGIITATSFFGTSANFSGNVSIGGTLTYEDVTNVDSVGIITARSGVDVTGNISVTGTVDGRDVASDGSKLDGIESGATADQTAAEILTLIKTVDGAASGLDADTLDGIQSGSFLRSDAADTMTGRLTFANTGTSATFNYFLNASNDAGIRAVHFVNGSARTTDGGANAYTIRNDGGPLILGRTNFSTLIKGSGDLTYNSNEVWHAANDGSGSGLDADMVDGVQLSGLIRSQTGSVLGSMLTLGDQSSNYRWNNTTNGRPADAQTNEYGTLLHLNYDGSRASQFAWDIQADNLYLRTLTYSTDTGTAWKKVWTDGNDGSGSGLDADTVDGNQAADLAKFNNYAAYNTVLQDSGFISYYALSTGSRPTTGSSYWSGIQSVLYEDKKYGWQLVGNSSGGQTEDLYVRKINNNAYGGWSRIWTASSDGAGSGLDADTLDGISSASFLRSDAADTFTGILTSNVASTGAIVLNKTVATNYAGISWHEVGDLRWLMYVSNNADGTFNLQARKNGTNIKQVFSVNQSTGIFNFSQLSATIASNTIWHAGNDGAGSGLDADLLDGKHKPLNWGNDAYAGSVYTSNVNADNYRIVGSSVFMSSSSNTPNNTGHLWTVAGGDTANRGIQMFSKNDNTGNMWFRCLNGKTWHKIWTSGNDGAGSGLDADTVDGFHSYQGSIRDARADGDVTPTNFTNRSFDFRFTDDIAGSTRAWDSVLTMKGWDGSTYRAWQLMGNSSTSGDTDTNLYFREGLGSSWGSLQKVWTSGNDGSGSGLDADTLDGIQSTGFLQTFYETALNSPDASGGSWVVNSNTTDWGQPKFGNSFSHRRYADGSSAYVQYNIPSGYKSCWISQLQWSSGGYADCYGVQSDGDLIFLKRINTRQTVENTNHGDPNFHDGSTVTHIGSGLEHYTAIRIQNKVGRIHLTGIAWTKNENVGYEGTGMVHPAQISHQGAGSGLDADTLDGISSASFLRSDTSDTTSGDLTISNSAPHIVFNESDVSTAARIIVSGSYLWLQAGGTGSGQATSSGNIRITGYNGADLSSLTVRTGGAYNTLWHAGNDGSGSGLDADLLDGVQASQFLRSDATDQFDGNTSGRTLRFRCPDGRNAGSSSGSLFPLEVYQNSNVSNSDAAMTFHISGRYATYFGLDRETNDLFTGGWSDGTTKHKIWHAGNDGSGSGLDADLLDGLQLHTGTNNEANKVVRTDGNGFINAGWINTISGDRGSTIPSRIYGSNDAYIRYYDLASFRSFMNVTAKANYQGREQNTSDTNYWTGSMGWGAVDLNTVFHYGSGDWDAWGTPANRPSTATSHWNGSQVLHYTNGTNAYGYQIACGSSAGVGELYIRARWGASFGGWSKIWNAANDGSGSGLDADTIDGTQLSNLMTLSGTQTITGNKDFDGTITYDLLNGPTNQSRDKIRVWNNSAYSIGMKNNFSYGGLGNNGTEYAMTFQMSNTTYRGWWWGDASHTDAQGAMALTTEGRATIAHSLRIGYGESDSVVPGATHRLDVSGSILATSNITAYSDINLKKNIEVIPNALDKVSQIRGITFDRIDIDDEPRQSGVIAQEVEKVLPEVVRTTEDGTKTVAYGNMVGLLIEAIKEQQKQIDDLKAKLEEGN